jgi:phosphate uptake regulator
VTWQTVRGARAGAAALLLLVGACASPLSIEGYLNDLSAITVQMTRDAFDALPPGAAPTHEQVGEVVEARRRALAAIEDLSPPEELELEHQVLLLTFADFIEAGSVFLDETSQMSPEDFREALSASTQVDLLADRVTNACDAMRLRAEGLGFVVSLAC